MQGRAFVIEHLGPWSRSEYQGQERRGIGLATNHAITDIPQMWVTPGGIAKNSVWIKVSIARSSPSCGASVASVAHTLWVRYGCPLVQCKTRARAQARSCHRGASRQ